MSGGLVAIAGLCCTPLQQSHAGSDADDGWSSLFNERDLDGWTAVGSAKWRVEDSVIVGGQDGDPRRSGLLATTRKFKDFELELDFMIDEHGKYNSGVYLRNESGTARRSGYQVNIGRGAAEEYCAGIFTDRWLDQGRRAGLDPSQARLEHAADSGARPTPRRAPERSQGRRFHGPESAREIPPGRRARFPDLRSGRPRRLGQISPHSHSRDQVTGGPDDRPEFRS